MSLFILSLETWIAVLQLSWLQRFLHNNEHQFTFSIVKHISKLMKPNEIHPRPFKWPLKWETRIFLHVTVLSRFVLISCCLDSAAKDHLWISFWSKAVLYICHWRAVFIQRTLMARFELQPIYTKEHELDVENECYGTFQTITFTEVESKEQYTKVSKTLSVLSKTVPNEG